MAAKGIDGSWRVKLFSDRGAIDYVRVMLFEDFGQLIDPDELNAPPLAALDTLSEATPAQTTAISDAAARRSAAREAAAPPGAGPATTPPGAATPPPASPAPGGTE